MSQTEIGTETETEADDEGTFVGTSLDRVEDRRILTGEAEYIHDITPEGCLHVALLRTTHPRADIVGIDTSEAEDHPECELVLTGEDVAAEYNPMPSGLEGIEEWALARDQVRFVGEPVALVAAEDRYVAEDLIDMIEVAYDTHDPVVDPVQARQDETVVHEDLGTNVPDKEQFVFGDVDEAFREADTIVENQYSWGRISGVPLETAGVVAEYDEERDRFDIDCNIQLHTLVDDTVYEPLGYDPDDVSLNVPPDVGGSFGTKIAIHRYCVLAAIASKALGGTPVKFVEDRIENLQGGDMHSSDREYFVRLACDDDGTIRGLDVNFVDDFGAYPRYPVNQALKPLSVLTNAYDVDNIRYNYELVLTNKTAQTAYRGFGVPPHLYAMEMALDEAASKAGIDPYELRQTNLIGPEQVPYKLPSDNLYDSGDYPGALADLKDTVEDEEQTAGGLLDPEVVAQKREEGKYRGVGYSVHIEPGVSGSDWTDRQRTDEETLEDRSREDVEELPEHLRGYVDDDGTVVVSLATDSSGQGHQTIVKQLLADALELLPSDIEVEYLDSVEAPTEYGTAASRMAVMLSGATQGLGEVFVDSLEQLGARHWGIDRSEVSYRDGAVHRANSDDALSLADLADLDENGEFTYAEYDYDHPAADIEEFDDAFTNKVPVYPTAAFAANAPIVEVDVETGHVEILKFYSLRDCGTQLNPTIVEGQAMGGLAQGIGAALLEEFSYDESGQPKAITLFDYLLPSVKNIPEMELLHTETPSPFTATGAKGTGEGGMIDGPASIAVAINRALASFDVVVDEIPATPHRLRRKLRDAGE
jgi:2-furoyl-CoA dehydrogenase large subunit